MVDFTSTMKDRAILVGWIVGLILIAALIWSLTFSFRSVGLMRSTNRILSAQNDTRRLSAPLSRQFAAPVPLGIWYSLADSDSLLFVFVIMRDGILVPFGAVLSSQGEVTELIPLGSHAHKVMGSLPQGLIQVYVRRIETAAAQWMGGR